MKRGPPQAGCLFRLLALVARGQLRYHFQRSGRPAAFVFAFLLLGGMTTMGTITAAAIVFEVPLLFPPLAPSAFILFSTPLAPVASPRHLVMGHLGALAIGVGVVLACEGDMRIAGTTGPLVLDALHVTEVVLAMGIACAWMTVLRCYHPPAAATALMPALGLAIQPYQLLGFAAAVLLLAAEGFCFNRLIGGLPYPLWRMAPERARHYGRLAGQEER